MAGKHKAIGWAADRMVRPGGGKRAVALCFLGAALWLCTGLQAGATGTGEKEDLLDVIQETCNYEEYLAGHAQASYPEVQVTVKGTDYLEASDGFYEEPDGLCTLEEGSVTYQVEVPQAGFFKISLSFYPLQGEKSFF